MFKIYTRFIAFFQRPKPKYDFDKFIETHKENEQSIENDNVENVEINATIDIYIETLKNKNKEFIQVSKNSDYYRNLFLYELGFTKLKRVRDFIITMNKVGNIEDFNNVESKYSKYKLELVNKEMLNILKKEFELTQVSNDKFDDFIPDITIDTLKISYDNLEKDGIVYNSYRKYYQSDEFKLNNDSYFIQHNLNKLKKSLNATNNDDYPYISTYYYKIERKPIIVCYNKNKGMILLEVEPDYFLILSDWTDKDGNKMDKLDFKSFIKAQE